MVAKSFQNLEIVKGPYEVKGRSYVMVKFSNGSTRQVRWYSEYEYNKIYHMDSKPVVKRTQKEIFGFDNGYITIFKGNTYLERDYFRLNSARYHKIWGWYFVSTEELPNDIPADVEAIRLPWDAIGLNDGTLKPETEITKAIEKLIYDEDPSTYQGEKGDKLNIYVTIEKVVPLDGYYGPSNMHIMRDENNNCYIWTTTTRSLNVDTKYHITGTVKDHKEYKNTKQTILTRCKIIEGE